MQGQVKQKRPFFNSVPLGISTPEEEEQQLVREERMEDEGGDIVIEETVMKEHQEAKAEYVPQSPQYTPASKDEEEDMSSDEDRGPILGPQKC